MSIFVREIALGDNDNAIELDSLLVILIIMMHSWYLRSKAPHRHSHVIGKGCFIAHLLENDGKLLKDTHSKLHAGENKDKQVHIWSGGNVTQSLQVETSGNDLLALTFQSLDGNCALSILDKASVVWIVRNKEEAHETNNDTNKTFNNEKPFPTTHASCAIQSLGNGT